MPNMNTADPPGLFLVTGGSRGIGAATVLLAAKQFPVALFYRERAAEVLKWTSWCAQSRARADAR